MGGKKLVILFVVLTLVITISLTVGVNSSSVFAKPGDIGKAGSFPNKGQVALSITQTNGENIPESKCPTTYASIDYEFKDGVFGPNGRCNWGEKMLSITKDGHQEKSFCLDWDAIYMKDEEYEEVEPVKYFTDQTYRPSLGWKKHNEEEAKEALRVIALYYYYLTNNVNFGSNSEINESGVYYFGQTLIWRYLNDYYDWGNYTYWVETADKYENNKKLFPDPNASSDSKVSWENNLISSAVDFARNGAIDNVSVKEYEADLDKVHIWWPRSVSGQRRQPQIQFDNNPVKKKAKYDFSLDSACVNCEKVGASDVSYVIQDVDNWKLLEKLNELEDHSQNNKVKDYFKKGLNNQDEQVCREEFQITFPDNSKVYVESGGYFTVNEDVLVNNVKPIHIDRIIKCKKNNGKGNAFTKGNGDALKQKFCNGGSSDSVGENAGNVKIWYSEEDGSGYNAYTYGWKDMKKVNKGCGLSYDSDEAAVLVISSDYRLEDGTFQYVKKGTATVVSTKNDNGLYTTIPYPNFPIHFNHKATKLGQLAGKISVKFELPDDSNMKSIYGDSAGYRSFLLKDQTDEELEKANIYYLYSDEDKRSEILNDEINSITIKNSACAKMFGFGSPEFENCVNERASIEKKTGICRDINNADDGSVENGYGYTCKVYMNPTYEGSGCKIISVDENKYIGSNGKTVSKNEFISSCCTKDNYKILGANFDFKNNTCNANPSGGGGGSCNQSNVGTGVYANMIWAIKKSTGQYGCCTRAELDSGQCSGKPAGGGCKDGINGPCGDDKKCACDSDNKCPNDHSNGQCPTSTQNSCEQSGSLYKINGQVVDREKFASECCNASNAHGLSREWNDTTNTCCALNEVYNKVSGKCVDKPSCDRCEETDLCCGNGVCGIIKNNELVCHGKPRCIDPTCKDDAIYRVVDLDNPFVGIAGDERNTGSNWASLDADGAHYNSKPNNDIVESVFGENSSEPMYKFTLDMDSIDRIRAYNNGKEYNDFTLRCDENGVNCESDFIRAGYISEKSGTCLNGGNCG